MSHVHQFQGSLASHMKKSLVGPLKEDLARRYTRQLVEGVNFLHSRNVMHRDIKGDNLLRDSHGNIRLADFGCAKDLEVQCISFF